MHDSTRLQTNPTRTRRTPRQPAVVRAGHCLRCGFALSLLCVAASAEDAKLRLFEFRETHLGVPVALRVYATDEASANGASRASYERIEELNAVFSDYDAESEAQRLVKSQGPVNVSEELYFLLDKSITISKQTEGLFDVTAGPLVKQWRRARRMKALPAPAQIASAQASIGYQKLKLNPDERTVEILERGVQLDFGGIAKCHIAEEAYRVLEAKGCPRSLVSVAGDIFAGDPPPDAPRGWKVGIAPLDKPDGPPSRYLALKRQAVSTSGDAFQYVEIGGVRYSHIVDPKTGLGLTQRSSVTVIAPHGWMADGYATAICLVGPERGLKLLSDLPEAAALIVLRTPQDTLSVHESPGFTSNEWK